MMEGELLKQYDFSHFGKGIQFEKQFAGGVSRLVFRGGEVTLDIVGVESHRCCVVAYAVQTNAATQGMRFLAFGIRFNEDADRGVGVTLQGGYLNCDRALKHCPTSLVGAVALFLPNEAFE
jgi:hypothetical protein